MPAQPSKPFDAAKAVQLLQTTFLVQCYVTDGSSYKQNLHIYIVNLTIMASN